MNNFLLTKIKKQNQRKLDFLQEEFEMKLAELLEITESPIESLLLLKLFDYFGTAKHKYQKHPYGTPKFIEIEFIEETFGVFDTKVASNRSGKRNEYKYRFDGYEYSRAVGIKTGFTFGELIEPLSITEDFEFTFTEIEIYPQNVIVVNANEYRADFAILIHRIVNGQKVETKRIVVECDGHKFHSTPEQVQSDNTRQRRLKTVGWEVVRYSGREIYNMNDVDKYFTEIIDIVFPKV